MAKKPSSSWAPMEPCIYICLSLRKVSERSRCNSLLYIVYIHVHFYESCKATTTTGSYCLENHQMYVLKMSTSSTYQDLGCQRTETMHQERVSRSQLLLLECAVNNVEKAATVKRLCLHWRTFLAHNVKMTYTSEATTVCSYSMMH